MAARTQERSEPMEEQQLFPHELLVEILKRLPHKSIFRFKCVSKHWFSLISDPSFRHSYARQLNDGNDHLRQPWTLLSARANGKFVTPGTYRHPIFQSPGFSLGFLADAPGLRAEGPIKIIACDNGLMWCRAADVDGKPLYYVCNPLTMKWVPLPDPLSHPETVKEGFAAEIDGKFWVVRVAQLSRRSKVFNFDVFSSEAGEWRYSRVSCPRRIRFFVEKRPVVVYKGFLHWLVDDYCIIAFDPKNDMYRLFDLPIERESRILGALGVSDGHLRYCEAADSYLPSSQTSSIALWVLEDTDNGGDWCLQYRIRYSEIGSDDAYLRDVISFELGTIMRVMSYHPFVDDVVFLRLDCYDGYLKVHLVALKFSTNILEIVPCEGDPLFTNYWEVFPFVLPVWPTAMPRPSWLPV